MRITNDPLYRLQELMDGESVQRLMGLLLAIGNYMNTGICFTCVSVLLILTFS